jgi:hypothetical protein
MNWITSKTLWGVIAAVLGALNTADVLSFLPPSVAKIVLILGAALGAIGMRDAIAKGPTVTP